MLTGLMVLLFLRDWRSAFIVVINIPLSLLRRGVCACGSRARTFNLMTLGGLALAVGILVDEATVTVENIHTHLARGQVAGAGRAGWRRGKRRVPRLLAMLCILAVFIPGVLHGGRGQGAVRAAGAGGRLLDGRVLSSCPARWCRCLTRLVRARASAGGGSRRPLVRAPRSAFPGGLLGRW